MRKEREREREREKRKEGEEMAERTRKQERQRVKVSWNVPLRRCMPGASATKSILVIILECALTMPKYFLLALTGNIKPDTFLSIANHNLYANLS